jgi:hypothetical protein
MRRSAAKAGDAGSRADLGDRRWLVAGQARSLGASSFCFISLSGTSLMGRYHEEIGDVLDQHQARTRAVLSLADGALARPGAAA